MPSHPIHDFLARAKDLSMAEGLREPFDGNDAFDFVVNIGREHDEQTTSVALDGRLLPLRYTGCSLDFSSGKPSIRTGLVASGADEASTVEAEELYLATIGRLQSKVSYVIGLAESQPEFGDPRSLYEWYISTVQKSRGALLCAHLVSQNRSDGTLSDVLIYPKAISEGLRFIIKQGLVREIAEIGVMDELLINDGDGMGVIQDAIQPTLRGEDDFISRDIMNVVAAFLLPPPNA